MNNIFVRLIKLPTTIKGSVVKDENDDYNIYINSLISHTEQKKTLEHEMNHIRSNHFYDERSVAEKEAEAQKR